ncbi:hypothetical protein B0H14DRAFT_3451385 [Mycena olivaceomarginata]|nr:hypothetical protein B0H14DRAFT_3451385 [Mycena olivaceomarginata]
MLAAALADLKLTHPCTSPHTPARATQTLQQLFKTTGGDTIGLAPTAEKTAPSPHSPSPRPSTSSSSKSPPNHKSEKGKYRATPTGCELLHYYVLRADSHTAFKMGNITISLCLDLWGRIARAVDLVPPFDGGAEEHAWHKEDSHAPLAHVALQVWAAWQAATLTTMVPRLARAFSEPRLRALSKIACLAGKLSITSTRFKTRVLASHNQAQRIEVESTLEGKVSEFSGKTVFFNGRAVRIASTATFVGDSIRVTIIEREAPTRAETQRADLVRRALQRTCAIFAPPFCQAFWLVGETPDWERVPPPGGARVAAPGGARDLAE